MNLCRCFIVSSDSESGILPRSMKVLVTSYFLSCFLSETAKKRHRITASDSNEEGRALEFSRPSLFAIVCIAIYLYCFLTRKQPIAHQYANHET